MCQATAERPFSSAIKLYNHLSSFGRRPGQRHGDNICGLCEAWHLYRKRDLYKPEAAPDNSMIHLPYTKRARAAWEWLQGRISVRGLDLNAPIVNYMLVCHFRLVDLFKFYAELAEQKRIYFTAGNVAKAYLVFAQQRAEQQPKRSKRNKQAQPRVTQQGRFSCNLCGRKFKSRPALGGHVSSAHRGGNLNARRPRLLPGCFEMGKHR